VRQGQQSLAESGGSILGRPISQRELNLLFKYLNILIKWQRTHRLVGSGDPDWVIENLILDSLLFVKVLPSPADRILDLGSGAGVPGIPLAIVLERTAVTLVEARQKRGSFLAFALRDLGLTNAKLLRGRLEVDALPSELAGVFDAVVARCVGGHSEVVPLGLELAKPGGVVIVSGPPEARRTPFGEWITVGGVKPGSIRRFAVVARPASTLP
jgi:16S rRNA (guanine527-N7)-methyltransferase